MEEVKSPNNEVSEKISEIIRDMGIEFFMNEKSLLIIDSYESKGKLYKTVVNAVEHLTIDPLLKKSIMDSFKRNTLFSSDSDILNLFIGKDLKKGNTFLLNELFENCKSDKENTNNNMKKIKFDKVIMNPPYDIGGKIWDEVRKVSENIVCLMPLAQYKANERYKYINYFEVVNNTLFDAIISGNLCITTCQSKDNGKNYEDFLFDSFNQNYRAFYDWNRLYIQKEKGTQGKVYYNKPYTLFNIDLDFALSTRAVDHQHCISVTGKGFDYYWNVLKEGYENTWASEAYIIHFNSKEAKNNFTEFIYSKVGEPFMSKVIRGLNLIKVSSLVSYAIPQIDWEKVSDHPLWKEGKYDEAVLDTMGLKWEGERIVEI